MVSFKVSPYGVLLCMMIGCAHAQTVDGPQTDGEATDGRPVLGDVVVIGTRRTDRTVTESASPVDLISNTELRSEPASNLLDQIKYLVPSFFVGQNTISDASSIVRAPSLRGLPSDEILVMLNGKRLNRSALVQVYAGGDTELSFGSQGSDISSIPAIGIKTLEVLRDGATAQYGSDAIAGVMNYGLRDDVGYEVQARYGQYPAHGDGKSRQIATDVGFRLGPDGFVNIAAEYDDDGQTSRGVTRPIAEAFAEDNPSLANQLPNYPLPVQIWGSSPTHGYKLLLNSSVNLTDHSQLYLFGNLAYNLTNESFNYRSSFVGSELFQNTLGGEDAIGGRSFFQHPYYETPCPAQNPTCPTGGYVENGSIFNLSSIYPAGFTPRFVGKTTESYGSAGYKGKFAGGLTYDLSVSSSQNTADLSMYDSFSPSYGAASQRSFEFGRLIQQETDANLDVTYPLDFHLATPVTLSSGAEFRRETFTATPGDPQSYGAGPYASAHPLYVQVSQGIYQPTGDETVAESPAASGYGGTNPRYAGSHSQQSRAVYLGLEGDLLKTLSAGLAARNEHYDSFGSATVGKVNAIWHLQDALALRGTIGTGFHAPSPAQNNTQVLTTTFLQGVSLQQGTFPVSSTVAQYYGAKPLKPEESTNYGVGIVWRPTTALVTTVDLYQINVRNRIFISRSYTVTPDDIASLPELASVGIGGSVQYFTNAFDTATRGLDWVSTYKTSACGGTLDLSFLYNYNKTDVTKYDPSVIATYQIIDIGHLAPNHRATIAANWARGDVSINVRENYFGSWQDANDYPTAFDAAGNVTAGQTFSAKVTTDLQVSVRLTEHTSVGLGANNLFNVFPDKIRATVSNPIYTLTGGGVDGSVYPRSGGPFGINGAFWYVSLRTQF